VPISWAPFYGKFTQSGADSSGSFSEDEEFEEEETGKKKGQDAVGGYNPDEYAPGVGQEPTGSDPAPPPTPAPSGGGGGSAGVGGSAPTGGVGPAG
jgi:hypothetical protein